MNDTPDQGSETVRATTYEWTPARIMLGVLIVAVGVGFTTYVVNRRMPKRRSPTGFTPTSVAGFFDMNNLTIDAGAIKSGGPGVDGIPSLRTELAPKPEGAADSHNAGDSPTKVIPAAEAGIPGESRVVGVEINGEARAYPVGILNWHEAVNDVLGETPICVVYCPLCDSFSVVDRRMDGETLEFGISGMLTNSNVLLYDRNHQALWSQVKLEAISGPYAGRSLKHLDGWRITTLDKWTELHPDSTIISNGTGHPRDYSRNPYVSYFMNDQLMFPVERHDERLPNKTPVIGVRHNGKARAYIVNGAVDDQINGEPVKLTGDSATGAVHIEAVPEGAEVIHTFWFAWAAFHPDTEVSGKLPTTRPATTQPGMHATSQPAKTQPATTQPAATQPGS